MFNADKDLDLKESKLFENIANFKVKNDDFKRKKMERNNE